jgi:hypothetical protein
MPPRPASRCWAFHRAWPAPHDDTAEPIILRYEACDLGRHAIDRISRTGHRQRRERPRERPRRIADGQTDAAPPDVDPENAHRSMLQFVVTSTLVKTTSAVCALIVVSFAVTVPARQDDRARTEALAARAGDRMQALHREADQLAAQERTLLGDLRKLELERQIKRKNFGSWTWRPHRSSAS